MWKLILFLLFLIGSYLITCLFTGIYPSAGHNTATMYFKDESNLIYQVDGFYNTEEGSFYIICPDINYEIAYINEHRETLALIYQNTIYDSNYDIIYNIVDHILYYDLTEINGSLISRYKYNMVLDEYVFIDRDDEILGTVSISGRDYRLNFTREVDARLYKTFLVHLSYIEHKDTSTCNILYFYTVMATVVVIITFCVLFKCINRKRKEQTELKQQLLQNV